MKNKRIWVLFATIAAAVVTMSFLTIQQNLVYFYTPSEIYNKQADLVSKSFRVGGLVKPESILWKAEELDLKFTITDLDNHEIDVIYAGAPPDMFKENQGVVIEGRILLANDRLKLRAERLFVKHSEEYKKPESGDYDIEYLKKSILKD